MQNHFGLIDTDVMRMFMVIALDIVIIMRSSINCSVVICSPTVLFAILREATSETCGPWVSFCIKSIFHHISFRYTILQSFTFHSINKKYQKYYFTVYPSISDLTLQITMKELTTPLSRWVQVGVCLCRYSVAYCIVSYWIDTLVLKS